MKQSSRVKTLESKQTPPAWQRCHRLVCRPGQSIDEARASYGEDKIAAGDLVVVRTIIPCPPRESRGEVV